jgi:hypothetical protein
VAKSVQFTEASAARISKVVRRVEGTPIDLRNTLRRQPRLGDEPDWIRVIVKHNGGSAGTSTSACTLAYDLYLPTDTGNVTKLNKSGAIQPKCSRARIITATITAAPDNSVASAYYDETGTIQLFDCQEIVTQNNCS